MNAVTAKRFTLAEYHRLGELGFFAPDERVELIRGEIIQMPTKKTPHSVCNSVLVEELVLLLGRRARVRGQEPIILPADSEPQPDVVIARNRADKYLSSHPEPADILLVVEIFALVRKSSVFPLDRLTIALIGDFCKRSKVEPSAIHKALSV